MNDSGAPQPGAEGCAPPFDLPAEAVFDAPHLVWLLADRELTVRAVYGNTRLVYPATAGNGDSLLDVAPELQGRAQDLAALLGGRMERLDSGLVRRPGVRAGYSVWAQTTPLRDKQGAIAGVVHMLADATALGEWWDYSERQRRELAELRQRTGQLAMDVVLAQSELQRLDDAKTQFVSAAAHELRNPLASLIGYLELLEMEESQALSEQQRAYLAVIRRGAQRLRVLTNNLLDITRIDSNRLELVMMTMDSLELVEQAVSEMQPLFDAKKQRLLLKAEQALPLIWCDKQRALQILANLLSNAHKYTPEGGSISVQVSRQKNKPMVCIRIKDTGVGIPPDDQYRIFTRFYRAGNAGAADGTGAGLGMSITQSLVRLHGGKLWFESTLGKGSSFFVTFPIAG